jgi:hypothetical protein
MSHLICAQDILKDVKRYNLKKIENKAIKKTRDRLDLPKEEFLFGITLFRVNFSQNFTAEKGTFDEFLGNIELYSKLPITFVCDSTSNMLALVEGKYTIPKFNKELVKEYLYIQCFKKIEPEYIFEYIAAPTSYPMYFCYKQGNITLVYLSEDGKEIISYPLSELKDWKWLNLESRDW